MLTAQQLATLKAAILADPVFSQMGMSTDDHFAIAAALNLPSTFIVWRTNTPLEEIMRNGMDWTRVDNLSVGKARIWDWLSRLGTINAAQANVRAGIDATWVGTAADLAVRAAVYSHCKRAASRAEALFATGTGTDVTPGVMTFEGFLNYQDVETARNS